MRDLVKSKKEVYCIYEGGDRIAAESTDISFIFGSPKYPRTNYFLVTELGHDTKGWPPVKMVLPGELFV